MKYLALALLLCALLPLSNVFCQAGTIVTPGKTYCRDIVDSTWHEVGSTWRNSDCMDCTCEGCHHAYSTPVKFPDDCMKVFDSEACEYIVHKKDDPTELCPIYGAVGK